MASDKYLTRIDGKFKLKSGTDSSAGAGDAGKIIALGDDGKLDNSVLPNGIGADQATVPASGSLAAGDEVNLFDDSGTMKVRKADATTAGKESDGFVEDAYADGESAVVKFDGTISGLSGLTPGATYFLSTTAGSITTTAPSAVGNVIQEVGKAKSATELVFERGEPTEILS